MPENDDTLTKTDEASAEVLPSEKPMGFFQHLEELRWTLVKSALVYALFAGLVGYYLGEFNHQLLWPWRQVQEARPELHLALQPLKIFEVYGLVFQVCMVGALAPAAPFIIYFFARFIAPALTSKELRMIVPGGLTALFLFLMGAALGFFILVPKSILMAIELNELMGFTVERFTQESYYSALVWLVAGVGLSFEFPLLVLLLVYLRLMTVAFLRKYRRHAAVVILIIAAVITPTQDPVTLGIFAAPLYILYEAAIIAGALIEKKRAKAELV